MMLRLSALACCVAACAAEDPPATATPCSGLVPGDLVLTEVFADHAGAAGAPGTDDGHEWIELHAAAAHPVELAGVAILHSRTDGSREKRFTFAAGSVEPGAYFVVGDAPPEALPAHVDDSYGRALGDLVNTGGRLAIVCGATTIDEATYLPAGAGRSYQLDGSAAPDYVANDDAARWCPAASDATAVDAGDYGTPGAANAPCGAAVAGMCEDGGALRPVRRPAAGALAISEVMANPAGNDGLAEWIELRADDAFDLNELVIGRDPSDPEHASAIASARCLPVAPGAYALLARSLDPAKNGGLPAPAAVFDLTLGNSDASVFVAGADGTVLDALAWTTSRDGVSLEARDLVDAAGNDDPAQRCEATVEYGPGRRGTPGSANDCGKCLDGAALRPIRAPGELDLEIAEWMANPEGLPGDRGEYIELRATRPVDLNGLQVGRGDAALEPPLAAVRCLALDTGASAVLVHAGSDIGEADGTFAFSLVQSTGTIVVAHGGTVVDRVAYAASMPGRATIVDERGAICTIPADAQYRYNGTDHGTPRGPNPPCR